MTTACICRGLVPRSVAMDGRAVFKMLVSSICIKKLIATSQGRMRAVFGSRTAPEGEAALPEPDFEKVCVSVFEAKGIPLHRGKVVSQDRDILLRRGER